MLFLGKQKIDAAVIAETSQWHKIQGRFANLEQLHMPRGRDMRRLKEGVLKWKVMLVQKREDKCDQNKDASLQFIENLVHKFWMYIKKKSHLFPDS